MKNLTLFCFLVISVMGHSQSIFSNATWYYGVYHETPLVESCMKYTAYGDTLVSGKTFTKISGHNLYSGDPQYYLRKEGGVVYYFRGNKEYKLFDFNVSIGDTVLLDIRDCYSNLDTIDIYEQQRVVITGMSYSGNVLSNDSMKTFTFGFVDLDRTPNTTGITETVLLQRIYTHSNLISLIDDAPTFSSGLYLRCYQSDSLNYKIPYWANTQKPCDYSNVAIQDLNPLLSIRLYPNPATNYLSVNFEKGFISHVNIHDFTGKCVAGYELSGSNHDEAINISGLPVGVYQCIVETSEGLAASRIVIE